MIHRRFRIFKTLWFIAIKFKKKFHEFILNLKDIKYKGGKESSFFFFFSVECQLTNVERLTEKYHMAAIVAINNSDKTVNVLGD